MYNYKFTKIKVTKSGDFQVNDAFIEKQYDDIVLITVDCHTKYPEVFAYSSANSIFIIENTNIKTKGIDSMTEIAFPEFSGWNVHSYNTDRYSIHFCLTKREEDHDQSV